jgi:hypothetical protein
MMQMVLELSSWLVQRKQLDGWAGEWKNGWACEPASKREREEGPKLGHQKQFLKFAITA